MKKVNGSALLRHHHSCASLSFLLLFEDVCASFKQLDVNKTEKEKKKLCSSVGSVLSHKRRRLKDALIQNVEFLVELHMDY